MTPGLAPARLWAATRFPYLASALFAMQVVERGGSGVVGVDDRWRLYVDPAVAEGLGPELLGTLLVHHAGHLLRDHAARAGESGVGDDRRDTWLRAADFEVNDDLLEAGLVDRGSPDLPQAVGAEPGQLAEEYFDLLLRHGHDDEGTGRRDCGSGAHGGHRPWELGDGGGDGDAADGGRRPAPAGIGESEARLLRAAVAAATREAAARHPGTVPGGWRRWADAVLEPRVDWRRALAAEVRRGVASASGRVDYSYQRPSRRSGSTPGVVLPALRQPVPEVAVVCDTSASMTDDLLGAALAEVEGILRSTGLRGRLPVLAVDTDVQAVRRVARRGGVELAGGGGTDMRRGIEAAVALRPRPSVVVVLTDGWTPWPDGPPAGVHVVVGVLGDGTGPAGRVPAWARQVRIPSGA